MEDRVNHTPLKLCACAKRVLRFELLRNVGLPTLPLTFRHSRVFKSLCSRDNIGIIHHIGEFVNTFFEFFLNFLKFLLFDN